MVNRDADERREQNTREPIVKRGSGSHPVASPLATWVKNQKTQYRKYETDPSTSQLTAERVDKLKELGALGDWGLA